MRVEAHLPTSERLRIDKVYRSHKTSFDLGVTSAIKIAEGTETKLMSEREKSHHLDSFMGLVDLAKSHDIGAVELTMWVNAVIRCLDTTPRPTYD